MAIVPRGSVVLAVVVAASSTSLTSWSALIWFMVFSLLTGFVRAKLGHFDGYQVNAYNKGCMEAALRVISTRFSRCTSLAKTQANADASEERVH